MSGKSLKIGIAAIAILLMTVAAVGAVSAATVYNLATNQITGVNITLDTGPHFNITAIGTWLNFSVNPSATNLSAKNFTVYYQAGIISNVTNGSVIVSSATKPAAFGVKANTCGTYWVKVVNANNTSEYVYFTVQFKDTEKVLIKTYPPYTTYPKWQNVTVELIAYDAHGNPVKIGVPEKVYFNDTSGNSNIWVATGTTANDIASDTSVYKNITGSGNFSVVAVLPNNVTASFEVKDILVDPANVTNTTTISFVTPGVGYIAGNFYVYVGGNYYPLYATTNYPVILNVTPLNLVPVIHLRYTIPPTGQTNVSYYVVAVPPGNYSVTGNQVNATTGQVIAVGSIKSPIVVQAGRTSTGNAIVFTYVFVPENIVITENKHAALATGKDTITLYATLYGKLGNKYTTAPSGYKITFKTTLGELNNGTATGTSVVAVTNSSGVAGPVTLTSTQQGTAVVTAIYSVNVSANVTKLFYLYGKGTVAGEVRTTAANNGTPNAYVWIIPRTMVANNYVSFNVANTSVKYIRVLEHIGNKTVIVPYDYYVVDPSAVGTIARAASGVIWCNPVLMGCAGEGYNVSLGGTTIGLVFLKAGNYTIQVSYANKLAKDLTDKDFVNVSINGKNYYIAPQNVSFKMAEAMASNVTKATGVSVRFATVTSSDGGYDLYGIYGNGSAGVTYVLFAEKPGYRLATKVISVTDTGTTSVWWPPNNGWGTDFALVPRTLEYRCVLYISAIPKYIPTGGTSLVIVKVVKVPLFSVAVSPTPVPGVQVTLTIPKINSATNTSYWQSNHQMTITVTTNASGMATATFVAGSAVGDVPVYGQMYCPYTGHLVNSSTVIHVTAFAQLSGYVMNVTYGPLVSWAKEGRVIVALWTYNKSVSRPDPKYCQLIPAASVNYSALKVIADYYGVNISDIKFNTSYASTVIPSNPRYAATNAGYAFSNLLVNGKPLWVAAYVVTPNGTKAGWAHVAINYSGTTTANIVVGGVPYLAPTPTTPTSWITPYVGINGTITLTGVNKAIQDWLNNVITLQQLNQVINYWLNGTKVV